MCDRDPVLGHGHGEYGRGAWSQSTYRYGLGTLAGESLCADGSAGGSRAMC